MPRRRQPTPSRRLDRREFLRTSAAGLGALALPADSYRRLRGANERLAVGIIGLGGMGTGHLHNLVRHQREQTLPLEVAAVCDIYEPRKQRGGEISKARVFHDYGDLLAEGGVDVVWIAVPDHWHATMTLDALRAGKDVYCEKPLTLHWEDAKKVRNTAFELGRVVQVGSQGCSEPRWGIAAELLEQGRAGRLVWSQTGYSRNSVGGEWNYHIDAGASTKNLDWKRWLGPAPSRPFDPERFFRFRKYWDYSGGIATDLFSHVLHALLKALGPDFPTSVASGGGIYVHKDREVPDTFHMAMEYRQGHSVLCVSSMANEVGVPVAIHGDRASLLLGDDIRIVPEEAYLDEESEIDPAGEVVKVPATGNIFDVHYANFLECVKTRGKPNCHLDLAYRVTVALDLAVRSYREQRHFHFDPDREEVV